MARPRANKVSLSNYEVKKLRKLMKSEDTCQTIYNRCRILLALNENQVPAKSYNQCVKAFGVSRGMIANTVKHYTEEGLKETLKLKRNINSDNARRKVDERIEARIAEIARGPVPTDHARWTLQLLEDQLKEELDDPISRETIRRTLIKMNISLTAASTGDCQG